MSDEIKQEVATEQPQQEQSTTSVPSADQIEKEVLDRKLEEYKQISPEDKAARLWQMYWPMYSGAVGKLSMKQLRRLLRAVIEIPLNDKPYKLQSKEEKEIFAVVTRLLEAKWEMMLYTLAEHQRSMQAQEEALKQAGTEAPAQVNVEEIKGE